jgi:hypothetical protein
VSVQVLALFMAESAIEGLPLLYLAITFLYRQNGAGCVIANCDHAQIAQQVNERAAATAAAVGPGVFPAEYVDAVQSWGCDSLPLTDDGWFTTQYAGVGLYPVDANETKGLDDDVNAIIPGERCLIRNACYL